MPYDSYILLDLMLKDGIVTVRVQAATDSAMSKPLSASIKSPGSNLSNNPQFSVIFLSLTLPSDLKLIVPCGITPMRYFYSFVVFVIGESLSFCVLVGRPLSENFKAVN